MEKDYNGWTNWETWNTVLWLDNEYFIYQHRIEIQKKHQIWNKERIKTFFFIYFKEKTPDMENKKQMEKVNWKEIADNFNDEKFD